MKEGGRGRDLSVSLDYFGLTQVRGEHESWKGTEGGVSQFLFQEFPVSPGTGGRDGEELRRT